MRAATLRRDMRRLPRLPPRAIIVAYDTMRAYLIA